MEYPYIMESPRLLYRALRQNDLEAVHKMFNEPSRRKWFYFQEPDILTLENARHEIDKSIKIWSGKVDILAGSWDMGIELKKTGELIGSVGLAKFHGDEELEYIQIGYHTAQKHQCKGYATEATKAIIPWGFERLREIGEEPIIEADVEHENWSSRKVLEKAGFEYSRTKKYVTVYRIVST